MKRMLFITGTDTGAGKTVLTALLAAFFRGQKINVAAFKPVCSGGRDDAQKIFAALDGAMSLDEINPWHFRAAIAPLLAAKLEKKRVKLSQVTAHIRARKDFDVTLVEGAGGLLSSLGEDFASRDLIVALGATPIIVAQNKLGAVNHLLLTLEALPKNIRARTKIVLMSIPKADAASESNAALLARFFPREKIFALPWLGKNPKPAESLKRFRLAATLVKLAR